MIKTLGGRRLGVTSSHKRALMRNMATSLFLHERIETTIMKAKDRKSTRLNSSHIQKSRMPSSA